MYIITTMEALGLFSTFRIRTIDKAEKTSLRFKNAGIFNHHDGNDRCRQGRVRERVDISGGGINSLILCGRLSMIDETIKVLKIKDSVIKMGLTMLEGGGAIDKLNLQISDRARSLQISKTDKSRNNKVVDICHSYWSLRM